VPIAIIAARLKLLFRRRMGLTPRAAEQEQVKRG
jgi:hypothetical protein